MSPDILDRLRAADPAANMPETTPDDRERFRRAIVATPPDAQRRRRRLLPRRRFTLIAVCGAIVLLGGTAAYGELYNLEPIPQPPSLDVDPAFFQAHGFSTWKQANAQYDAWTNKIGLPAGAEWRGYDPGQEASMYSVGAGAMSTVEEAMGHWTKEWIAATTAGDDERAAMAQSWVVRLRVLIPVVENLNQAGTDQETSTLLDAGVAEAKKGHFGELSRMVVDSTIPWSAIRGESGPHVFPAHHAGWTETLDGPTHANLDETVMAALTSSTAADVRQEYRDMLKQFEFPPGATVGDPTGGDESKCYGDGFVYAFDAARSVWWREWVAADQAGDQKRVAAAAAASERLRKSLPCLWAAGPFTLTMTLDDVSMTGFESLDAQARRGDMQGIKDWLQSHDAAE